MRWTEQRGQEGGLSALGADHHAAAAPAVQEQDALLPPLEVFLQLLLQQRRQPRVVAPAKLLLHVRQADLGQVVGVVPGRHGKQVIPPGFRGVAALHRRGGRAQQEESLVLGAAELRHLPGVVPDHALRLVAPLLLFVQDHQPQLFQRGEHRRPGPDDHRGLAVPDPLPLVIPLPGGKAAVEHRHLAAEVGDKNLQQAGGQGNFGDHHNGPPPLCQGLF